MDEMRKAPPRPAGSIDEQIADGFLAVSVFLPAGAAGSPRNLVEANSGDPKASRMSVLYI